MSEFQAKEYGDGGAAKAAAVVAGFTGTFEQVEPSARALVAAGYDVVSYTYGNDAILSGDAEVLPTLIHDITTDFKARTSDYSAHRHAGASLGGGIAWNIQKATPGAERGLYAAAGTNVAKLIMKNAVFRGVVRATMGVDPAKQFRKNDWTPDELAEAWADIHEPPVDGFVVAVAGLDYIVRRRELMGNIRRWQSAGIPIDTVQHPLKGHTGIINWFRDNTDQLLALSDS